ncbi:caspase-8-like [Discoglossus pictus]
MDFTEKLYCIDSELGVEDVEALKFLCCDKLPGKKLEVVKVARELFDLLISKELIQDNDDFLLAELLYIIGQHHLLKILNTSKQKMQQALLIETRVDPYRRLLYKLSENITTEDLKSIVFLLSKKLTKKQKEKMSVLEIFNQMEKNEIITEDNLDALEKILRKISPDLLKDIAKYKEEKAAQPYQETEPYSALPCETKEYENPPPLSIQVVSSTNMEFSFDDQLSMQEKVHVVQGEAEREDDKAGNLEHRVSEISLSEETTQIPCYTMNRKHRGHCLIINNLNFMWSNQRKGTKKDAEDLERVLTWLGMKVEIFQDQGAKDIHNVLETFRLKDHTERDCFICCILTHGESGVVLGSDNNPVTIYEITSYFTSTKCKSLATKPKLFFIQACQGKDIQNAYSIETDATASEERKYVKNIPDDADFLLGMSTVNGFAAMRHKEEGAWYIQALCSNLLEMVPRREDILSILTKVNEDVSLKEDPKEGKKQMPQPAYTLTKKLIFPVPQCAFES